MHRRWPVAGPLPGTIMCSAAPPAPAACAAAVYKAHRTRPPLRPEVWHIMFRSQLPELVHALLGPGAVLFNDQVGSGAWGEAAVLRASCGGVRLPGCGRLRQAGLAVRVCPGCTGVCQAFSRPSRPTARAGPPAVHHQAAAEPAVLLPLAP